MCLRVAVGVICSGDFFVRHVAFIFACVCAAAACHLMKGTAGSVDVDVVDMYNSASGAWSTAQLSVARSGIGATSVGNVAIFAGGHTGNSNFSMMGCSRGCFKFVICVKQFEAYSLVLLAVACVCTAAGCRVTNFTAGTSSSSGFTNAVDLYNSASGTWSTARLSVERNDIAATSVGNVAIFAGGQTSNSRFANSEHAAYGFSMLVMQQLAVS